MANKYNNSTTVVIPFYNSEKYFAECINSALNQSLSPLEIIVVNDSPSIASQTFLEEYSSDTVKIIQLDHNSGPAKARNIGIANSRGTYIAFLDSDDKWHQEKLEIQVNYLNKNPDASAVHTGVQTFCNNQPIKTFENKPEVVTIEDLLKESQVLTTSLLIRKKDLEDVSFYNEALQSSEDYELTIRLVLANKKIIFLPKVLSYLRREQHDNISSNWKKVLKGHLTVLWKYRSLYFTNSGLHGFIKQLSHVLLCAGYKSKGLTGKALIVLSKSANMLSKITK